MKKSVPCIKEFANEAESERNPVDGMYHKEHKLLAYNRLTVLSKQEFVF